MKMSRDLGAKALAMILPNAASMIGCMLTGECALLGCCKSISGKSCEITGCSCPIPTVVWHLGLLAGNASCGYASYLVWKELRGIGCPEHCVYSMFLLSSAAHPILMKKCGTWGCGPAIFNCLCGVGLAGLTLQLFMKTDRNAGYFMIPGVILALLGASCTFCCANKKNKDMGGSCCSGGSCCRK